MFPSGNRLHDLASMLSRRSYPRADEHPIPVAERSARVIADVLGSVPWRVQFQSVIATIDGVDVPIELDEIVRAMIELLKLEHRVSVAVIEALLRSGYSPSWVKSAPIVPRAVAEKVRVEA